MARKIRSRSRSKQLQQAGLDVINIVSEFIETECDSAEALEQNERFVVWQELRGVWRAARDAMRDVVAGDVEESQALEHYVAILRVRRAVSEATATALMDLQWDGDKR